MAFDGVRIKVYFQVEDHISRLISENEAIVEPNPVLLKRRPYHRQSTSNSITSQSSECNPGGCFLFLFKNCKD